MSIYENLDFESFNHYWKTEIYDIFPETPVIQTDKKWQKMMRTLRVLTSTIAAEFHTTKNRYSVNHKSYRQVLIGQ